MRAVQRRCEVAHLTDLGTPRVTGFEGRTSRPSQEVDQYRVGGRWWLSEPGRDVWVLMCGPVLLEVTRYDEGWNGAQWWILRIQD